MTQWHIIERAPASAEENMAFDQKLLEELAAHKSPILHLYEWEQDAATYGYFVNPSQFLNMEAVQSSGLQLAKRSTGGGIVFHISDLAFSVLLPASHPSFSINTLENYALINQAVLKTIQSLQQQKTSFELLPDEPIGLDASCTRFCMAKPTKYDVVLNGKKFGGAAQRRTQHGLLHQGTISLGLLSEEYLKRILLPGTRVLEAMNAHSGSLLTKEWDIHSLNSMRKQAKEALKREILLID